MARGGARKGSGRKPGGPGSDRIPTLLRLDPDVRRSLDAEAEAAEVSRSDVANARLRRGEENAKPRS